MSDEVSKIEIQISGLSSRDENQATGDLRLQLSKIQEIKEIDFLKKDKTSQDMGATLIAVLGTGAALAVAKGIQAWISRWHSASITIKDDKGTIIVENITSSNALEILEILKRRIVN